MVWTPEIHPSVVYLRMNHHPDWSLPSARYTHLHTVLFPWLMISLYFTHGPTGMTLKHITCLDKSQSPAWLCIRSSLPRWREFTLQYTYLAMGKSPKFHHELKNYDNWPTHGWIWVDFPWFPTTKLDYFHCPKKCCTLRSKVWKGAPIRPGRPPTSEAESLCQHETFEGLECAWCWVCLCVCVCSVSL